MRRRLAIGVVLLPLFVGGLLAPSALGGSTWRVLSVSGCKGGPKRCTTSTGTSTTSSTSTTTSSTSTTTTTSSTTTTTAPPPSSGPACTLYASPSGRSTNDGLTAATPLTLVDAYRKTTPGAVVCLLSGTYPLTGPFYISRFGQPGAPITYRGEGSATIQWTATAASQMFVVTTGGHDLVFSGLTFDGAGLGGQAVITQSGSHHIRFSHNIVRRMGAAGFATLGSDYITVDHNLIWRFGDAQGWSSGVSLNSSKWFDQGSGYHSQIVDNVVAGGVDESTHHSDGNGIIYDLGGNTPPLLIQNNLVYENGGRCIETNQVANVWVVNNVCYMNGLDSRVGQTGSFQNMSSQNIHLENNIAWAWTNRYPYYDDNSSVTYSHNLAYGGYKSHVSSTVLSDPSALLTANPRFLAPVPVDATADGQWRNALDPTLIADRWHLADGSPGIDSGDTPQALDTSSLSLLSLALNADFDGAQRPQGAGFDLGVYER